MKKLDSVAEGQKVIVKKIDGDIRFMNRITSIGLATGCQLSILRNEKHCPILIYSRDTMIAVNRQECMKIQVEEVFV